MPIQTIKPCLPDYYNTTNRQMVVHLSKENIQLGKLSVFEMDSTDSSKRPTKFPEFGFDGMHIFCHKLDNVNTSRGVAHYG